MKQTGLFIILLVMLAVIAAGCRSKADRNTELGTSAPSTSEIATLPETQQTERIDPTINSGNGPIEETEAITGIVETDENNDAGKVRGSTVSPKAGGRN